MAAERRFGFARGGGHEGVWRSDADECGGGGGGRRGGVAGGPAAPLALASAVPAVAQPITTVPAVLRVAPRDSAAPMRWAAQSHWRAVRVPPGILAAVPTGASPTPPLLRPSLAPIPVGFAADPY